MDGLIQAAARALAAGDPLAALGRVALRDDAPALALRGIALAQLGDFERARPLVRRAARAFGARDPVARARCVVAEAEIALASRDLGWPTAALEAVRAELAAVGPEARTTVMDHQLRCHALGAPGKDTWNLEPWRPELDYLAYLLARCNPTSRGREVSGTPRSP
ncbi:DUF2599 domain-containing protein [Achromobacter insuavis]|uniref:DUF2599 domain-containing protein n=1 Tax=Achromobacter insuavis TaxID=1287735 RepID=UPI00359FEFD6